MLFVASILLGIATLLLLGLDWRLGTKGYHTAFLCTFSLFLYVIFGVVWYFGWFLLPILGIWLQYLLLPFTVVIAVEINLSRNFKYPNYPYDPAQKGKLWVINYLGAGVIFAIPVAGPIALVSWDLWRVKTEGKALQQSVTVHGKVVKVDNHVLNLERMHVKDVSEIQGLGALGGLKALSLANNDISEIRGLDQLVYLERLDLSNNKIETITGLNKLTRLKALHLHGNAITEIKNLTTLTNLRVLTFGKGSKGNRIARLEGVQSLTKLTKLNCSNNQISRIEHLATLTKLKKLVLARNLVPEITGVDALSTLHVLNLDANKITTMAGLEKLTNLRELHLANNKISRIQGIASLSKLTTVTLTDNPLITDHEPLLQKPARDIVRWLQQETRSEKIPAHRKKIS